MGSGWTAAGSGIGASVWVTHEMSSSSLSEESGVRRGYAGADNMGRGGFGVGDLRDRCLVGEVVLVGRSRVVETGGRD